MTKINHSTRFFATIGTAFALTLTIAASNAFAGPSDDARMETVKYGDLNLNSDAGVSALYRRIHAAAQNVCATSASFQLSLVERTAKCVEAAEAGTVRKVNAPRLTAWYEQKMGKSQPTIVASN
jgi:UrcA family protein